MGRAGRVDVMRRVRGICGQTSGIHFVFRRLWGGDLFERCRSFDETCDGGWWRLEVHGNQEVVREPGLGWAINRAWSWNVG